MLTQWKYLCFQGRRTDRLQFTAPLKIHGNTIYNLFLYWTDTSDFKLQKIKELCTTKFLNAHHSNNVQKFLYIREVNRCKSSKMVTKTFLHQFTTVQSDTPETNIHYITRKQGVAERRIFIPIIWLLTHSCSFIIWQIFSLAHDLTNISLMTTNNSTTEEQTLTCKTSRRSKSEFFLSVSSSKDKLLIDGESFNSAVIIHCFVTSLQLQLNRRAKHMATSSDASWSFRWLYSPRVW